MKTINSFVSSHISFFLPLLFYILCNFINKQLRENVFTLKLDYIHYNINVVH